MDNIVFMPSQKRRFNWAGYLLGFALGGLFDGILLHQVLQWHHFLSGVTQAPFNDPQVQTMADGVFHAAMYVIAAIGVRKLLQARVVLIDRASDRLLASDALIGFGAWHVADGVLSQWLLELHHVRMDVVNPEVWDLVWFLLFGVLFIAAGIALRMRREPPSVDDQEKRRRSRLTWYRG